MTGFTDTKIDIDCPECTGSIHIRLRDVQNHRLVTCPRGHQVQLKEKGHGLRDADRAMRDLERSNT